MPYLKITTASISQDRLTLGFALCILFNASVMLVYNYQVTQFPGNQYFDASFFTSIIMLSLLYLGSLLLFDKPYIHTVIKQLGIYFSLISLISFYTTAIQYTPFPPIDGALLGLDKKIGIHLDKVHLFLFENPTLKWLLLISYASIHIQLIAIPILLILLQDNQAFSKFCFLLTTTAFIGFTFYYFFPTLAPASQINSPFFTQEQYATSIKFFELHTYIPPSTPAGGMIAMPSFHVIWGCICQYSIKKHLLIFKLMLPINCLLIFSCFALGWHYYCDLIGSLIVLTPPFLFIKESGRSKKVFF